MIKTYFPKHSVSKEQLYKSLSGDPFGRVGVLFRSSSVVQQWSPESQHLKVRGECDDAAR